MKGSPGVVMAERSLECAFSTCECENQGKLEKRSGEGVVARDLVPISDEA